MLRSASAAGGEPDLSPPALATVLSDLPPGGLEGHTADLDHGRSELFHAVGSYLRQRAAQRPILAVVDDLHAADLPSLLLLEFLLGGGLRQSRVALIAVSREQELRRSEDLNGAALRIRRLCRTIRLQGLDRNEVAALIGQAVAVSPSEDVIDAIHEATEGNPLFVEELTALLPRADVGGRPALLPDGIRETIRQRLAPLSREGLDVLSVGAVFGREFDLRLVGQVAGLGQEVVADAVHEAVRAGLVSSNGPVRYRFTHILLRDVLYGEMAARRRAQLHAQVGRVLEERHKPDLEDHLDELAHHFYEAVPAGEVEPAVRYALGAAGRAETRLAYEGAVRQYELALGMAESTGWGGNAARCDILLALGRSYGRSGRADAAKESFRRAAGLARQLSDGERLGRAALGLTERVAFQRRDDTVLAALEEALAALPESALAMRARLLGALARVLGYFGMRERTEATAKEAVEVARALGEPRVLVDALGAWQVMLWGPDRIEERMEVATEVVSVADGCGDRERALEGHMSRMICQLELGDTRQFDRSLAAYTRQSEELRQPRYTFVATSRRAMRELMRGHFDEGRRLAEDARRLGRECQEPDVEPVYHGLSALPARDLGDGVEAVEAFFLDFSTRHTSVGSRALLALFACDRGDLAAARSDLEGLTAVMEHVPKDMDWLLCLALCGEVAHAVGDAAAAAAIYPRLARYERRCALIAGAVGFAGSVAHYLGLLSATLGRLDRAEGHFAVAAEIHGDMGARPWLARTLFEHGRVLLAQPEEHLHGRGRALVAQARVAAEELGMTGLLRHMSPDVRLAAEARRSGSALLRRQGAQWIVRYGESELLLADAKGLHHIARLLARPGHEVHALDLVGGSHVRGPLEGDAGPLRDDRAKAAYRQRLETLRDDIEEAEAWSDQERASRARTEMEAIAGELAAAVGLGGRDRRAASAADRARVSVRKAIARALRQIDQRDPSLGRYLATTIRTGTYCVYEPDPRFPVTWEL